MSLQLKGMGYLLPKVAPEEEHAKVLCRLGNTSPTSYAISPPFFSNENNVIRNVLQ